ncbi:MAG: hypothetical protein EXR69_09745 [Myxococcales bacterium]|nr:hypothetical protein [Myxococcales bacterium]
MLGGGALAVAGTTAVAFALFVGFSVGFRQDDLDALDPAFRTRAVALLDDAAREAGTNWVAIETARYAWRQQALYEVTRASRHKLLLTKVPPSRACHVSKVGWGGARAVDVRPSGHDHAFYLYLRDHAKAHGLRSGAGFGKPRGDALGWDPGHLEMPGCAREQTPG